MPVRNILVPLRAETSGDAQLEAALRLARPLEAHLNVVLLRPDPVATLMSLPSAVACRISLEELTGEADAAEAKVHAGFDAWRARHGLADTPPGRELRSTYARWSREVGRTEAMMMRLGRLSDVSVLAFPPPGAACPDRMLDAAMFETGRPVLLAPQTLPDRLLQNVVIAWNGSLPATRAVAGALPILHAAETVSVFCAPWRTAAFHARDELAEPDSLPAYLLWHGIRARTLRAAAGERSIGPALLETAAGSAATLIVMGAYARSRLPGVLLGSATGHVLRNSVLPVLFSG